MSKRTLPKRSKRGQPPSYLEELPSPPKREQKNSQHSIQQLERKQLENKLKTQQVINLKNYPFGRAVHYFYDLSTFPRVDGHLSYVYDESNALQNTFSNDKQILNDTTYGHILNRKLFGLSFNPKPNISIPKDNRTKNVCSHNLYNLQDKKYQIDRLLCTLRLILKKLEEGISINGLTQIEFIKKDPQIEKLLNQGVSVQQKIEIIKERIQKLERRKESNVRSWEYDDSLYFYHSLNQLLHNRIGELKFNLSERKLVQSIYPQQIFKKNTLFYYNTSEIALKTKNKLKGQLPVTIFKFEGSQKILKQVNQIIAKRCQSLGQTVYYEVKEYMKTYFHLGLFLQHSKIISYPVYQKNMRKVCWDIKRCRISEVISEQSPHLDRFVEKGKLSFDNRVEIKGKDYYFIVLFYWLCFCMNKISKYIDKFPELTNLISSDYFPKVYNELVEATDSAIVGMLCAVIEAFSQIFSKPDPFAKLPIKLYFQFEKTQSIGMVFREDIDILIDNEVCPNEEQQKMNPSKKIKRDMI